MVVVSAKKNTLITLSIFAGCLLMGYLYALIFHSGDVAPAKPANQILVTTNNTPRITKDYFEEYRLERDRVRSRQVELLKEIINNSNSSPETRKEAQSKLLSIVEQIDNEVQVERVLVARGFKDAVVCIRPENITVIVKGANLLPEDTDNVKEVASQLTGISNEEIIVLTKK